MLEKLKELALRYEDLQAQLADPSVYGDADRLRTVNRELKELAPVAETYERYRRAEADAAAAEELLGAAQVTHGHVVEAADVLRGLARDLFGENVRMCIDNGIRIHGSSRVGGSDKDSIAQKNPPLWRVYAYFA